MREHKTLRFKTEGYDEEQGIFKGRAAVFGNIDSGDDIIEPGAFTKTLKDWSRVKLLALHNDQWLPIGRPVELREEKKDLYIEGKISDTSMGKDVKILIQDGVLNELSIGCLIGAASRRRSRPGTKPEPAERLLALATLRTALLPWAIPSHFSAALFTPPARLLSQPASGRVRAAR